MIFMTLARYGEITITVGVSHSRRKGLGDIINTLKIWKGRIVNSGEETPEADKALDELGED